jgi:hypothetical protein
MKAPIGKISLFIFLFLCLTNFATAEHLINGIVNDSVDLESPNNKIITLWNPSQGISDNLTDIIGSSAYSIDCELLSTPCTENDTLNLKIFDSGDGYATTIMEFNVTTSNPDYVEDMKLNSPPVVGINYPTNNSFFDTTSINFNCSYQDADSDTADVSLWANFSGSWISENTTSSSPGSILFLEMLTEGYFQYSCEANDSLVSTSSSIQFLTIDTTDPTINSLTLNTSYFCGDTSLKLTCDTYDSSTIDNVKIMAMSPSGPTNYSAEYESGNDYFINLTIDEEGIWNFTCYSEDAAGNIKHQTSSNIAAYLQQPNLQILNNNIQFDNPSPLENENITINVTINNTGCVASANVLIKFYNGDPLQSGTEIGTPQILSILNFSSQETSTTYQAQIGKTSIYVFADANTSIDESNESNNIAYQTLDTPSWQVLYGSIETSIILGSKNSSIDAWGNTSVFEGNVFISDSESQIDWTSLIAIGKKTDESDSPNDFEKIDTFLGTSSYEDSISNKFSSATSETFLVHNQNITSVKTIQSTDNDNFKTGILWDFSDDTNGEFGVSEQEDIVFVSKVNRNSLGKYGTYDYEVIVPAKLREYDTANSQYVYFYYDLI